MFNYQRSLTSSNSHSLNAYPTSYPLGRSNFEWSNNNGGSLEHNLNMLSTDAFNFGPSNQIISFSQPRFNQQLTEVRKTVITPHGIQIHTVLDISAPPMLPRINQNPLWDASVALRAPPPNSLPFRNQNFMENVNIQIPTPNWQARNIASIPNASLGSVLNVEPIQSYRSNNHTLHVPQLSVPNMNNQDNLANIEGFLDEMTANLQSSGSTSMTPTIATKIEPNMVPQQDLDDKVDDFEETEDHQDDDNHDDDDNDYDDGRTHSLPHQKHGPYTCPKCKRVFPISQSFASHVLGHYKRETPAERRRRHIAKYKKKGLQLTQSPHGLTVAHKSFKENSHGVSHPRKHTNQGITKEFTPVENQAQSLKHPQFDLRRPSTSGSTVIVKEEIGG